MYHEHFGLRQAPFSLTPQAASFYSGGQYGLLLDSLLDLTARAEGPILVSGPAGSGKTVLCHALARALPAHTLLFGIARPGALPAELLAAISDALQAPTSLPPLRRIERRLRKFRQAGQRIILAIEDVHTLPPETLAIINVLAGLAEDGQALATILLLGRTEFEKTLAQRAQRALRERIRHHLKLAPMAHERIADYLHHRLSKAGYTGPELFTAALTTLIGQASKGLTRHINIIADKSMLAAYADNTHTLTQTHIESAIRDTLLPRAPLPMRPIMMALGGVTVLALGSLILWANRPAPLDERSAAAATAMAPSPLTPAAAASAPAPAKAAPPAMPEQAGPLVRALLSASIDSLHDTPADQWFVQLRTTPAVNAARLETFLTNADKHLNASRVRALVVPGDPQQTIRVLYGSYPSQQAAATELAKLPSWIRRGSTFSTYRALQQQDGAASAKTMATAQ